MKSQAKKKYIEPKYLYRNVCSTVITLICCAMFMWVWHRFVKDHNNTGWLLGYGNQMMSLLINLGLTVFCFRAQGAYSIGVVHRMKCIASEVIALFITNFLETFISIAVVGEFRFYFMFLWRYILLFLAQSLVVGIITFPMITVYRRKFPPLTLLEVYGDYHSSKSLRMDTIPYKYIVGESFSYRDGLQRIEKDAGKYDAILVNDVPAPVKNKILKKCFEINKRVYFVPSLSDIIIKTSEDLNLFDTPVYFCRNRGLTFGYRLAKRTFDIVLSAFALVVLSPLFAGVAIAIKVEDGGPVFYKQERCTIGMRKFWMIKFRSMIVDAEKDGKSHPAGEDDDRITKVGRFIRATRIDELPQLINIIRGDMSIIGPRPERVEHVQKYMAEIPEFRYRYKVRGGLSGYAQVYGKYNTTALDKLKLDLIYIENCSLAMDVQIIFETFKILFQKESTEGFSAEQQKEIMGQ